MLPNWTTGRKQMAVWSDLLLTYWLTSNTLLTGLSAPTSITVRYPTSGMSIVTTWVAMQGKCLSSTPSPVRVFAAPHTAKLQISKIVLNALMHRCELACPGKCSI
ncbi:MAG: hypothetical protein ACYS5F_15270 [Planctomycetota bacterium]